MTSKWITVNALDRLFETFDIFLISFVGKLDRTGRIVKLHGGGGGGSNKILANTVNFSFTISMYNTEHNSPQSY